MSNAMKLYFNLLGISMRAQLEYRASFVLQTLGNFLGTGIEFVAIYALFERFDHISGWRLPEVAFLYGIVNFSFAIAESLSYGFDTFGNMVKQGDFDRLLLRPRSTVLQLMGQNLAMKNSGRLLQALAVLVWSLMVLDIAWTPAKFVLAAATVLGAVCLFYGLVVVQATIAFWTTESLEVMNTMTYGGVQTAQYPLSLYPDWLRTFFTYVVPLGCVSYFPVVALLEKHGDAQSVLLHWLAPAFGVLFLCVALRGWNFGVRHYTSTGS